MSIKRGVSGKRFIDESLFNKTYKGNNIARQKDKICYAIFDSEGAKFLEQQGVQDVGYMDRETTTLKDIAASTKRNCLKP